MGERNVHDWGYWPGFQIVVTDKRWNRKRDQQKSEERVLFLRVFALLLCSFSPVY